ncbi:TolC family protein [Barnesiella viscericola]|uniref:TolC family protein n=1 Tax=Barnesiella viscericola TaxID=397865 RepID=UPI00255B8F54|nr:TolC family protein [Barnesiella viscericola]
MLWTSLAGSVAAQVTLSECVEKARNNYPQIQELGLIREAEKYDLSTASQSWLPQLTISGKAQYQSKVVEMPFEIPEFKFNLPHDQYSLVGEVSQTIWDGGSTASKKRLVSADAKIQSKQLEVSLYGLRQKVENIFLGILLIDKQIAQNEIAVKSLYRNRESVLAGIEHGVSYQSDLSIVDVNILNYKQTISSLHADRQAYVDMLGRLTGEDLSQAQFVEPPVDLPIDTATLARPELQLYKAQLEQTQVQRRDLQSNLYPKLNLALQGGIGRPGLNILKNEFEPYYTVGVKLQWNLGALYSRKNDIRKIAVQKERIERQQEAFVLNTMLDVTDQLNEVHKAEQVLAQDREIIRLREEIRQAGEEQYKQGVIMLTDLMEMIDEEFNARVAQSLHQVQLVMAICDLKNTLGQ